MKNLNFDKPICATSVDGKDTYLLLPVCMEGGYSVRGYNWFNIGKNRWNSCATWKTKEEAVQCYHNVRNCEIKLFGVEGS